MRYSFLILLFSLVVPAFAQEDPSEREPNSQDYVAKLSVPAEEVQLFNNEPLRDRLGRQGVHLRPGQRVFVMDGNGRSDQCLTMHSIIVRQPRKDSDEVEVRGERTCTPASRFRVRNAAPQMK